MRVMLWLILAGAPALAHHSLAAEFDASRPVTLRGTITKLSWMNPHVYVWIDAEGSDGKVTNWMIESAAPNYLLHLGWSRGAVSVGDLVTIQAYVSKDQSRLAKMELVTLPDGRRLNVGNPK